MSKNLFLVQYQDQSYCDDTSETIDQVYLSDELYEKIQKYVKPKEILETKNSTYKISISYVENNDITNIVKNILIPAWIREIEKADTKFIDNNIERIMSSSGNISNILDLLNLKRNNYKDNSNVLVMVG
ncbi:hypothetical protein HMPREF2952_06315 [Neisseria sp. HMSC068C12]|jgi:hypothetical protein|uniref:hypothetical protein n=1 Tax=Neisseria sp. HMSC068C12 TaxID=1739456 RepID=UPI0008A345FA|nr:hypothetical protein [Neisseria sp. HMSC068C12]OFQ13730.1 hypothetical protein HMPREF2952_06315 [Neisseria sp. HMSC068C12]